MIPILPAPTSSEADGSGRHLQGNVFDNTLPFGNDDDDDDAAAAEDEEGDGDTSNQVTKSNSFFGISRTVGGAMTGLFFFAMTAGTVWAVKDNRSSMVSNSAVVVSPAAAKAKSMKAPVAKVSKTPKAPGGGGGGCDPTDPLSCYERAGMGRCTNIDGKFFDHVIYEMLPTATESDCASKCVECVEGSIARGSFRGFSFGPGFSAYPADCQCYFDDGGAWNKPSTCSGCFINAGNGGTGAITGAIMPPGQPWYEPYSCFSYSVVE
eukprot:scaffold6711_cov104-Skeletonema_dohrnii-CCMP3373.AAC.3